MEDSLTALFNITWGQCSAMIKNILKSLSEYSEMNINADVAKLLKEIRNISNELQVSVNMRLMRQSISTINIINNMTSQTSNISRTSKI